MKTIIHHIVPTCARYCLLVFFLIANFCACNRKDESRGITGRGYAFYARASNHLWVDNVKCQNERETIGSLQVEYMTFNPVDLHVSLPLSAYSLYITTSNVSYSEVELEFEPGVYLEQDLDKKENYRAFVRPIFRTLRGKFADAPDYSIESQLRQHLEGTSTTLRHNTSFKTALISVDYRTTPMKSLTVTFSERFQDIEAGHSLNHLVDVLLKSHHNVELFFITEDKRVIWPNWRKKVMPLNTYMNYKPMAPVELFLKFKDKVQLKEPVTGRFTVTIETVDGKVLSATTRTITLTP